MTLAQLIHYLKEWPGEHQDVLVATPDGTKYTILIVDMDMEGDIVIQVEERTDA